MFTIFCSIISFLCSVTGMLPLDTIQKRLDTQRWMYPQEKIWLAFDRNQVLSGDTVLFNADTFDAATLEHSDLSRYVYVEVRSPFNEVVKRIKVRRGPEGFSGFIPMPHDLPEGEYTVVAYTRFMMNAGSDYFYKNKIDVVSPHRSKNLVDCRFSPSGNKLKVTVRACDASTRNNMASLITVTTKSGKTYSSLRKKDSFSCSLKSEDWRSGVILVESDNFRSYEPLPPDSSDLKVLLYPEGGHFVKNEVNNVAIKILDSCGRGVETEGVLLSDEKKPIASVVTDSYGIGRFQLFAETDKGCYLALESDTVKLSIDVSDIPSVKVNVLQENKLSVQVVGNIDGIYTMLIHCGGILQYYNSIEGNNVVAFDTSSLMKGVNEIVLLDDNHNPLATRLVFIAEGNLPEDQASLLLQDELPGMIQDMQRFENMRLKAARYNCDNLMLATDGWNRYDMAGVINGHFTEPVEPLEVGGLITGTAKTHWKRSPLANAKVDVIAPSIDFFRSTQTDAEGRFFIDGIDWPENTKFVVRVLNKNGEYEDNFEIDDETYPEISVIPPLYKSEMEGKERSYSPEIEDQLSHWLAEVEVLGTRKEKNDDDMLSIYEIIGAKTIGPDIIQSRGITTYEEALRLFAGVTVSGGNVTYHGANRSLFGGDNTVALYVDDSRWNPAIEGASAGTSNSSSESRFASAALSTAAARTAVTMTGGLIPTDIAVQQYASTLSPLAEFSATFPFHTIERIYFLKPSVAMFMSGDAARKGGALVFVTKKGKGLAGLNDNIQVKVFSPLGFQEELAK